MQSRARTFTYGIQPPDARAGVEVHLYAPAHIVGSRSYGYVFLGYVNAYGEAFLVYVGEVVLRLLSVLVRHVEAHMVYAVYLHLLVYGTRHYVARCQGEALVILLHESLARRQAQYAAIASHRLRYEIGRMRLAGVVERRGVKLHKLHVSHRTLRSVHHSHAVARSYYGVRRCLIHGSASPSTHHRHLREIRVHLLRLGVQHIGTITLYVVRLPRHLYAQVVLRYYLYGKVVLPYVYVGITPHGSHQSALYLRPRIVGVVQYAEFRVPALAMQVEETVLLPVEVHAPLHQFLYLRGSHSHHLLHGSRVRYVVARNHRVLDVLLEVVHYHVSYRRHAPLCPRGVALVEGGLAYQAYPALVCPCHFQGVAHASHTRTDNQKIILVYHSECKSTIFF